MDPLSLVVGGALLGAGWVAGLVTSRVVQRGRDRRRGEGAREAYCSCGHARSFHDPQTNRCHQIVKGKATKWDRWGFEVAWEQAVCPCRRYDGPEPLAGFYVPEITADGD